MLNISLSCVIGDEEFDLTVIGCNFRQLLVPYFIDQLVFVLVEFAVEYFNWNLEFMCGEQNEE